jgi:hypothetical protein
LKGNQGWVDEFFETLFALNQITPVWLRVASCRPGETTLIKTSPQLRPTRQMNELLIDFLSSARDGRRSRKKAKSFSGWKLNNALKSKTEKM